MRKYIRYNEEGNAQPIQLSTIVAILISVMLIANITIMIIPESGNAIKPDFEIYASEFVFAADDDGLLNDAGIYVCDSNWNDVDSAKVYINNEWKGDTNGSGFLLVNDLRDGRYFVDVSYTNGTNVTFWAHTNFFINAIGEYSIYANASVFAADLDALLNDVRIKVNDSYNDNISGAYVYMDGKWMNNTNGTGMIIIKDLEDGHYSVDVGYTNETGIEFWDSIEFLVSAKGEYFIYANAYVLAVDGDAMMNDTAIYVYNDDNDPVEFAGIFINGQWAGLTNGSGGLLIKDLEDGFYYVDAAKNESNVEYWAGTEFKINVTNSFIHAEGYVLAAYGGWEPNDVRVYVYDHNNNPVGGAEVYIGWDMSYTADNGSITFYDLGDGLWIVDVYYMNEFGEVLWAMAEVLVDVGHVIYPNVYVEPKDPDGIPNDISIWVYDGNWSNVADAAVYLDGEWVNTTDAGGSLVIKDLDSGSHVIDVFYFDDILGEEFSGSRDFKIDLGYFIYAEAYVISANGREPNDVKIYVYDNDDNPIENANVYAGGNWGATAPNGSVTLYDLGDNLWQATVYSMNESGEWHWAWIDFMIDIGHVIYPDVYVEPMDPDGMPNDVNVWVVDNNWSSVANADVYLDGKWMHKTNEYGTCIVKNIEAGPHIMDVFYYDNISGQEYWGNDEFVIDTGYFIYAEAFVFPASGGMEPNDVKIYVYDNGGNPLEGANVYAGGQWGETAANGSITLYDLGDNLWKGTVWYMNESGDWHWAWIEFMIDVGHVIYADVFVGPNGSDGIPNDVSIWLYDNDWMSVPYANVYLNGDWVGFTDGEGKLDINDLDPGLYLLDVFYYDAMYGEEYHGTTEFQINLDFYIYAEAFVYPADADLVPNDVMVYLYDNDDNPLEGASVFINWAWMGSTSENGSVLVKDLEDDWYSVDIHYWNETYVDHWAWTEFIIEMEHIIYADVYVFPWDPDGIPNDVEVYVYDGNGSPLESAEVYINNEWAGLTDQNGSISYKDLENASYIVDIFYYDMLNMKEYWTKTEFIISAGEKFIFTDVYVYPADEDGIMNDLEIHVYDYEGNPQMGAEIYIDSMWYGMTGENGSLWSLNFSQGWHYVDIFIYGPVAGNDSNYSVDFQAWAEFYIGDEGYLWLDAFVLDHNNDSFMNDVKIRAYAGDNDVLPYADVYVDEYWEGMTDLDGELVVENISRGWHEACVISDNRFGFIWFYSEGADEQYIYIEHFVKDIIPDNITDDAIIYVYDQDDNPVAFAEVYFDGYLVGYTSTQGYITSFDLATGYHFVDVYYYSADGNYSAYAWTEIMVGDDYHYGDAYGNDEDGDNYTDDGEIWVYDEDGNPIHPDDYNASVDGEDVEGNESTRGDDSMSLTLSDLPAGLHYVTINMNTGTRSDETMTFEFISEGTGEAYIYTKTLTVDADEDGENDDARVYVYDESHEPVEGADVYVDGVLKGKTNANGYIEIIGISSADFTAGTHTGYASHDQLEAGIENPKVDKVVEPPIPTVRTEPPMTIGTFTIDVKHAIFGDLTVDTATSPGALSGGLVSTGLYFDIVSTVALNHGEWIYIKVSYVEANLPADIDESSLALYYWNTASNGWVKCENPDIDTGNNNLWANVSHLTVFAVFGKEVEPEDTGKDPEPSSSSSYLLYIVIAVLVVIGVLFVVRSYGKSKEGGLEEPKPDYELEDEEDSVPDGLFRDWVDFEDGGWDYDEDAVEVKEESIGGIDEYGCPDCGETLEADDDVCPGCGSVFDDEDEFSEDDDDSEDDDADDEFEQLSEEPDDADDTDDEGELPDMDDSDETEIEDDWGEDFEEGDDEDNGEADAEEDWDDSELEEDEGESTEEGDDEEEFVG